MYECINESSPRVRCVYMNMNTRMCVNTYCLVQTFTIDGLFKLSWLQKHRTLVPSVVVLTFKLDLGSEISTWVKSEQRVEKIVENVRKCVGERDAKVMLVIIREGNAAAEMAEQRVTEVKKRCGVDSKVRVVATCVRVHTRTARHSESYRTLALTRCLVLMYCSLSWCCRSRRSLRHPHLHR